MCEFKVLKKNELVFEDAVYAKAEGNKVTVRNVLGMSKVIENCTIAEVNVSKEHLILTPSK